MPLTVGQLSALTDGKCMTNALQAPLLNLQVEKETEIPVSTDRKDLGSLLHFWWTLNLSNILPASKVKLCLHM